MIDIWFIHQSFDTIDIGLWKADASFFDEWCPSINRIDGIDDERSVRLSIDGSWQYFIAMKYYDPSFLGCYLLFGFNWRNKPNNKSKPRNRERDVFVFIVEIGTREEMKLLFDSNFIKTTYDISLD